MTSMRISKAQQMRNERMIFDYETTYRTDFQITPFEIYDKTVYKAKPKIDDRSSHVLKDTQTLTAYKLDRITFDLLWRRKEIVRTNPHDEQKPFSKIKDMEREEAQLTRPRLVMTPAVGMDDISDPAARRVICKDMYTSTWSHDSLEAVQPLKNISAPFSKHPAPSNPIFLPQYRPSLVSPEWRRDTVEWESKQLRAHVDPDKEFWIKYNLYKSCVACKQTAQARELRGMSRK